MSAGLVRLALLGLAATGLALSIAMQPLRPGLLAVNAWCCGFWLGAVMYGDRTGWGGGRP